MASQLSPQQQQQIEGPQAAQQQPSAPAEPSPGGMPTQGAAVPQMADGGMTPDYMSDDSTASRILASLAINNAI